MNFIDLNLKAADEAAMTNALLAAGFIKDPETGSLYHPSPAVSLLLLPEGTVTREAGNVDAEGLPVREPVPGYHANVRTQDPAMAVALAPLTVNVETPQYVWAS